MLVEIWKDEGWVTLENATASHIKGNMYRITMTGQARGRRLKTYDNMVLRLDGQHKTRQTLGKEKKGDEIILEALVYVDDP